ncbi:hypothetical protein GCM10009126_04580 [Rhodanobacter caeni]|uniref:Uncharacterized protein n=1 Tax=Rhodanobacter caeni TaxID=657654 RepID=A0ABN0U8E9_9GAMM
MTKQSACHASRPWHRWQRQSLGSRVRVLSPSVHPFALAAGAVFAGGSGLPLSVTATKWVTSRPAGDAGCGCIGASPTPPGMNDPRTCDRHKAGLVPWQRLRFDNAWFPGNRLAAQRAGGTAIR